MTTSQHILGSLVASLLVAGCAGQETSSPQPADRRAELVRTEAAYYSIVRSDDGELQAARAGATKTRCGDGELRSACAISELDLSRVDMTVDDETLARAYIADGSAVVLAKLVADGGVRQGALVVTRIWTRDGTAPTLADRRVDTDQLFVLRDVHEACDQACGTCEWLRAEPLDGGEPVHYADLTLEAIGHDLTDAQRAELARGELLAHGAGLGTGFVATTLLDPFPRVAAPPTTTPPPSERPPVETPPIH